MALHQGLRKFELFFCDFYFFYFKKITKTEYIGKIPMLLVFFLFDICCVYAQISDQKHLEKQLDQRIENAVELNLNSTVLDADTTELKEVARLSEAAAYANGYALAHKYIGDYYDVLDQVIKAIPHYHQALKKIQGLEGFTTLRLSINQRIANCYYTLGRMQEAEDLYRELLEDVEKHLNNPALNANLFGIKWQIFQSLGNSYMQQGRYDEAITSISKAIEVAKAHPEEDEKTQEYNEKLLAFSLGSAYLFKGDGLAAKPYVQEHLDYIVAEGKDFKFIAQSYGNLAYCEYLLKNFDAAYANYDKSMELSQKYNYPDVTYITYKDLSDTYRADGKLPQAMRYLEQHYLLKDSLQNVEVQRNLDEAHISFETERKEQEILRLEQRNQIERQQKILFAAGLGLFLLLGAIGALYFYNINKRRKQKAELQELQLVNTQQELTYKKQDVTRLALEISNKQELTERLLEQISTLESSTNAASKKELRRLEHQVRDYLQSNEEQQLLQQNIEDINHAFYSKLSENYPDLSQAEKELCSYIRLGLSNKEIAALRNLSAEAVRTRRFRLRKKLNLDSKQDVEVFLQGL